MNKVEHFGDVKSILHAIVNSTAIHSQAHDIWEDACSAIDYLTKPDVLRPLYIVLSEPGPKQEFVELEDDLGRSVLMGMGQERYPGRPGLWRLGPLFALPVEGHQEPVPELLALPDSKGGPDGASGEAAPTSRFDSGTASQPNIHELKFTAGGEADAICSCGKWRLLRVGIRPERTTGNQRRLEIEDAFQQHLITVAAQIDG